MVCLNYNYFIWEVLLMANSNKKGFATSKSKFDNFLYYLFIFNFICK